MCGNELKTELRKLVEEFGPDVIQRELVAAGAGLSTADKLSRNVYGSEPKQRIRRSIMKVLNQHRSEVAS